MAGSSQPQHFFAAECVFADFAIAVIFYPVMKNLWKLCQSLNFYKFSDNFLHICQFNVRVWQHQNNMHGNVHKVFSTG